MFNPTKSKPNLRFGFLTPGYLWSNFMENKFFLKKPFFFTKKINLKKSQKTNDGFGSPTPDYLWSNFIKNNFFPKKVVLCVKKGGGDKKYKKLTSESDSSTPIASGQTL